MTHFGKFAIDGESPWAITVRNVSLTEVEQANGYERLRMELRDSDVGEFTLRLKSDHPAAKHLLEPGCGIVVRPRGQDNVVTSGFVTDLFVTESRDREVDNITAVGVDDNILLSELAYPNPNADVSTSSFSTFAQERHSVTAVSETAIKTFVGSNIGPAAGIARRRYSFLNIPGTTGLGVSATWTARFTSLLELCKKIAMHGGVSFRIVQSGTGELTLHVWEPQELPHVRFSVRANNLTSAVLTHRAPDIDEVVVGAEGEGAARKFTRRNVAGLAAEWGRRSVKFMDRRSLDVLAEVQAEADSELNEGAVTAGMTLYPIEQPGTLFGVDYNLGDRVPAVVAGIELVEPVRRVVIEHEAGTHPNIMPDVGLPVTGEESPEDAPLIRSMLRNLASVMRS